MIPLEEFKAGIKRRAERNRLGRAAVMKERKTKLSMEKLLEVPEPTEEEIEGS